VLVRLAEIVPAGVGVFIVADRGFGDQNLYRLLTEELHFEYVIRFRGNIKVTLEALLPRLAQHENDRFLANYVERHRKERAAADAETVSGPDASIPGTYLAKLINKHAAEDALFTIDDGTVLVWTLRHVNTGGKRRTFGSLLHGTMASGMPSAIGLQKCQPSRQVVCMAGDGGFSMLLGDLLTVVRENLPITIVVYPVHAIIRNSVGFMTRKLSVTASQ
jgi:thiamine pyrophosphate-dependent acetolactate synthase large subunit-like protein